MERPRPAATTSSRIPLIFRVLGSIRLGVVLLALILIYSSIISAIPPIRWSLEMTDMQAFQHWFFVVLSVLLLISLAMTTIMRIRWLSPNLGAVVAHIGLFVLGVGAMAYFGSKVEGHVLIRSPKLVIQANLGGNSVKVGELPAVVGERWQRLMPHTDEPITIEVSETKAAGVRPVASATVTVLVGESEPRRVSVDAGAADFTPVHESIAVGLTEPPTESAFFDHETAALYLRNTVTNEEQMVAVDALPIYHDRFLPEAGPLVDSQNQRVTSARPRPAVSLFGVSIPTGWFERWRMPIAVDPAGLPFTVEIIGYVPYVRGVRPREMPDGTVRTEPVLAVREQRRAGISVRGMSAICVKIKGRGEHADHEEIQWCLFSPYRNVDVRPLSFRVPGSDAEWELVYSRLRHDLNATIAAKHLFVEHFPGRRGIKSYHSEIMVQRGDAAPYVATVETNETAAVGDWTLYQSGFAEDRWSYSILGVGNRIGMQPMNIGWIVCTLGCLYAFYVKPLVLRRYRQRGKLAAQTGTVASLALLLLLVPACSKQEPYQASQPAAGLDAQIDWDDAKLLAVQDGGRYKTLDSFAREAFAEMTGSEHLPGLSPMASLIEWLFNRDAYWNTPVVKVRNAGIRARLTQPLSEEKRQRIMEDKRFTPREIFDRRIQAELRTMESQPMMQRAVNRVRVAQAMAERMGEFLAIVPQPNGDALDPWYTPQQMLGCLTDEQLAQLGMTRASLPERAQFALRGITPEVALGITVDWSSLRAAWLAGDAAKAQQYLDRLTQRLPALAAPGVYPDRSQRQAEARYYAAGKFTSGWVVYFLALLVAILSLCTGWRAPWYIAFILIAIGLATHMYGLSLRWYILGRIPVANMFEAVVASAAIGIVIALIVEIVLDTRVLLVGSAATGFLALVMGQFVLPGSELGVIPGILDDIMLRLHTVMIITAYALIYLAAIVAVIYLFGYYGVRIRQAIVVAAPTAVLPSSTRQRPLLAGATPGDEERRGDLPEWLNNIDWSHLILLNMIFVLLFVGGVILGAWWADYSWGRPWGWDPKEVFALNTWIVYAILIHMRFIVRNRGLWTAWLSILGCAMMAFNWFFVNFFIASIHSYV